MKPTTIRSLALLAVSFLIAHSPLSADTDLPTVDHVDLERYMGRWYEIAAFPQVFEHGCYAAQADYSLREDGHVKVVNSCHKDSLSGRVSAVTGTARVVDKATNAKLKVSFFWPFSGDYWILALDDNYEVALVGAPNRRYLWILSRQRSLDEATYQGLVAKAKELGFDVRKLRKMPQPTNE